MSNQDYTVLTVDRKMLFCYNMCVVFNKLAPFDLVWSITLVQFNNRKIIMSYFSELHYDIQEMYIEGYEPQEIASKLKLSIGKIVSVLNEIDIKHDQEDPA